MGSARSLTQCSTDERHAEARWRVAGEFEVTSTERDGWGDAPMVQSGPSRHGACRVARAAPPPASCRCGCDASLRNRGARSWSERLAGKAVDVGCVPRFGMEVVLKRSGVTALARAWQAPRRSSMMELVGAGVEVVRGRRWYDTPREGRGATAVEQSVEADGPHMACWVRPAA